MHDKSAIYSFLVMSLGPIVELEHQHRPTYTCIKMFSSWSLYSLAADPIVFCMLIYLVHNCMYGKTWRKVGPRAIIFGRVYTYWLTMYSLAS